MINVPPAASLSPTLRSVIFNDSKFVERLSGIQQHVILLAGPNIVVLGYEIVTPIKCVSEDAEGYGQR